jgi:hypothetical protein
MANKGLLGFNADLTWRCLKSLKFLGSSAPRGTRSGIPHLKAINEARCLAAPTNKVESVAP